MIAIERLLLCSVLENGFLSRDDRIIKHKLDAELFKDSHHKLFVRAINRLKELNEPVDSDTLRLRLIKANKWSIELEDSLFFIMTVQPAGAYGTFLNYYKFLKDNGTAQIKLNEALSI